MHTIDSEVVSTKNIWKTETDLERYYITIFKYAQIQEQWSIRIQRLTLFLLFICTFPIGDRWIIVIMGAGVMTQVADLIFKYSINKNLAAAHKLQKMAMLISAFKRNIYHFDISHIKGMISQWIYIKILETEDDISTESAQYSINAPAGPGRLCAMLQENAYWNYHLYKYSSHKEFLQTVVFSVFIFLFSISILSFYLNNSEAAVNNSKELALILKLFMLFLSSNLIYKKIEKIRIYRNSAETMLAIDSELNWNRQVGEDFVLSMFSNYNTVKAHTPLISEALYNAQKNKLNRGWNERKQRFNVNGFEKNLC